MTHTPTTSPPQLTADPPPKGSAVDVHQLTSRITQGDPHALTTLYTLAFARIASDIRSRTRCDDATAQDIAQDTFLRVIRALPVLETEAALWAWLNRTAYRIALDRIRSRRREDNRAHAPPDAPPNAPTDPLTQQELTTQLHAAIKSLEADHADLFHARNRLNWTLARIATSLGISPAAVHRRLRTINQQLQQDLDP